MPQFDTLSFFSQISWVFFLFALIYLLVSFFLSPTVSTILKVRNVWSDHNGNSVSFIGADSFSSEGDTTCFSALVKTMNVEMTVSFLTSTSTLLLSEIFAKPSNLKPFISSLSFTSLFRSHLF